MINVTLNVDADKIQGTVDELLANMDEAAKTAMVKEMLKEALSSQTDPLNKRNKEQEIIRGLISRGGYYAPKTEDEARKSSDFTYAMREYKSPRELLINSLTKEVLDLAKAEAKKTVAEDEEIKNMIATVIDEVKKDFPKIIQEALVLQIGNALSKLSMDITNYSHQANSVYGSLENIQKRLNGG